MISDIRQRPEFFDTVADRIWRAWWEPHGVSLVYIEGRLRETTVAHDGVPITLVAHQGDTFAGTAGVIPFDLDERPQYSPWIAAVWVEPQFRSQQVGRQLVRRAVECGFAAGHACIYLNARRERGSYYDQLGWTRVEEDVGPLRLTVFVQDNAP